MTIILGNPFSYCGNALMPYLLAKEANDVLPVKYS
jgi:hypothetical protein